MNSPTRGLRPAILVALIGALLVAWALTLAPSLAPVADPLPLVVHQHPISRVAAYYWAWALGLACGGLGAIAVLRRRHALSWAAFAPLLLAVVAFVVGVRWHYRLETLPVAEALVFHAHELFAPGMRLPLGLLLGGIVACGTARLLGAPWRAVGDAWALAVSAAIPIGRVGCLLAGCCMGGVCERWPSALCFTWPPGSEAYRQQLTAGLIPLGAAESLLAHPLPIYFALASLATLGVLLLLLHRNAPPGALLAAFCILRPAAKLALEPLRAADRGGVLMVAIPAGVLAVTCVVLAGMLARRLLASRAARLVIAARGDELLAR